jgi:hypothetical protein
MCVLNLIALFILLKVATGQLGEERFRPRIPGNEELQHGWHNWIACTNADESAKFTPMNNLAPVKTVFLAGYPTYTIDNSSAT